MNKTIATSAAVCAGAVMLVPGLSLEGPELAPQVYPFAGGGLAITSVREVFIDEHGEGGFKVRLARVQTDKLRTYRNLCVWREYDVRRSGEYPWHDRDGDGEGDIIYSRARYEDAAFDDFEIDGDGFGFPLDNSPPLLAASAFMRPFREWGWVIVTDLEPGTIVTITDLDGQVTSFPYTPPETP